MMAGGRLWTDKEEKQLTKLYPNYSNKRLSKIFNRTVTAIQHKANRLKLNKSKEYLRKSKSERFSGSGGANWNGGIHHTGKGYKMIYSPDHPNATARGYVMEHRLVMEDEIGRLLKENEVVHHKNGIKDDNRPENLKLMTFCEHSAKHNREREISKETRNKMSNSAKERFSDPTNHPSYKDIDPEELLDLREEGKTVKEICEIKDICKRTFYNKINKYEESA
jgi:hypothetical protein